MTAQTGNGGGTAAGGAAGGDGVDVGSVRVVVLCSDSAVGASLRTTAESVAGVLVLADLTDGKDLARAIDRYTADLVIACLDPSPDTVLQTVASVAPAHSDTAFFAASENNDANLILNAMRSGFKEFVRWPDESSRLIDAIGAMRRRSAADGSAGQVISVIGSAGGVGCTTLAVNLATELAEKCGREVALVDLDFQFGHVAMMLDLEIQHSIADLCGASISLDEKLILKAVMKHKSGVHVVARPREFEETTELNAESSIQLLALLRKMYPYVVLDGPPRSDPTGLSVLQIADWNLLVVQPLVTAARNAKRIIGVLERLQFDKNRIQVVCNRGGGGLSHLNIQRLEKSLGHKIITSIPDDWTSVSAAINLGEPLAMNAPRSKAREAIRELADTIRGAGAGAQDAKGASILGRLFGRSRERSGDEPVASETA